MAVTVVNMIPNSMSNETQRDAEPNITASYLDPTQIAASPFTPDPLSSGNAPIYVSTDSGATWSLNVVLPGGNKTGDTTLRFVGPSNVLYAGILRTDTGALEILRKANFTAAGLMTSLLTKTNDDQPYVEGATVMAGAGTGSDRVYVGHNDLAGFPGATATIHLSLDAATAPAPAGFASHLIETRTPPAQDGPPIRPAAHLDGTVYGVYMAWRSASTTDIVVVRDDSWGSAATPFASLTDPADSLAGRLVATGQSRTALGNVLGTQRVGGQCAIAVDPRNSSIVYIAWADGTTGANQTIHVRRSTNRGGTWSADIRTIPTATNPGLAINQHGRVGFLYQQLHDPGTGNRWNTRFESWDANLGTPTNVSLADVPDANGGYAGPNPIGDYSGLVAVGKSFYGIFSGNNTPDNANFPSGVTYQRNANFTTHVLTDLAANTVPASIDPFFFKVTTVEPKDDFYVRDWTDSPASWDNGAEPSSHPAFYVNSDVWNRRGTLPGGFANDQPENEAAGNGAGNIGDNWAFARVRRKAPATAGSQTVTAHFLVSKFGTGSAYVDATSLDPDVTFLNPDPSLVFNAADVGPVTAGPVQWHLAPVASTHLCLAVEITGPNDPFVAPSLLGNTPGWPTTDLRVVNDNNKAQRNMGLSTTPARGVGQSDCYYAIVRNAATVARDVEIRYRADERVISPFEGAMIEIAGGKEVPLDEGGTIRLPGMKPGENRWIGLRFPASKGRSGQARAVTFDEIVNGVPVNGFAIGARVASLREVIREKVERHRSEITRLAALGVAEVAEDARRSDRFAEAKSLGRTKYVRFVATQMDALERGVASLESTAELFGVAAAFRSLALAIESGDPAAVAVCHDCLLNRIDAALTMRQLAGGDVAGILHNVRWQLDLVRRSPRLAAISCSAELAESSESFVDGYGVRRITNREYPEYVRGWLRCLSDLARELEDKALVQRIEAIEQALDADLPKLQRAHQDYLRRLDEVSRKRSN
jgi:hypothetical protein